MQLKRRRTLRPSYLKKPIQRNCDGNLLSIFYLEPGSGSIIFGYFDAKKKQDVLY